MLASLLRPKKRRVYADRSPFSSPYTAREISWPFRQDETWDGEPGARYTEIHGAGLASDAFENADDAGDDVDEEEGRPVESTPLLPIFSASHLDALPVYDITHAIRPLIVSRCETTLTWDQLRSPQISQFLVKPIQQKIRALHFSRATLYALMANCLQFTKEIHLNPGNSGASQTRAMVSELLAIKLLREYSTMELIDALSYEFHPLQGQMTPVARDFQVSSGNNSVHGYKSLAGAARISCLEVAIRAQAKRFLAHPVVVQQLEAIWAGTIVFHSAADSLHRSPVAARRDGRRAYGTTNNAFPRLAQPNGPGLRRSVTLYDPRDASLFKLSRLRVPRYRQFLSTLSFAVLLGLFLAVLKQRSVEISTMELVFWFWSAGFMLDEIVGFNEQGFSLYLMSFWNLFDLGILFLLYSYYCMRLFGALTPRLYKRPVADRAYDILAANAVLLFPRLFSVLDHYRYFSQLLIAFRIMAWDLVAVFLLIAITCSGFFVAFTLSFGTTEEHSPAAVAYALFQMLMGFTPAAWSLWDDYNLLGKIILTVFLFICHFVVVTILITVLTNSFMAIVQNANQEHQFLFAVNTISMVKSDALFSYVAPTNILAWLITPLRYLMPFRQFIRLNRTIIKITHLPILFTIWLYEKAVLSRSVNEPIDLVDSSHHPGISSRGGPRHIRFRAFTSQAHRLVREPSVATYQKDRALEEVFLHPVREETKRHGPRKIRRESSNIVSNWMQSMGSGAAYPPDEQDSDEVDRLERPPRFRFPLRGRPSRSLRHLTDSNRSATPGPVGHVGSVVSSPATPRRERAYMSPAKIRQLSRHTGIEGDDELTSEDTEVRRSNSTSPGSQRGVCPGKATAKFYSSRPSTARVKSRKGSPSRHPKFHTRNYSAGTVLYGPAQSISNGEGIEASPTPVRRKAETPSPGDDVVVATSADQWTQKRHSQDAGNSRNAALPTSSPMSVPDLGSFLPTDSQYRDPRQGSHLYGLGSDLGDNRAIANGFLGALPSSLTTQMAYVTGGIPRPDSPSSNQDMLSKLVLARMNNIEEGFREMLREVKDLRRGGSSRSQSRPDELRGNHREKKKRMESKDAKKPQRSEDGEGEEVLSDGQLRH